MERTYKHGNYTKQPLDWQPVLDHIRTRIFDPELQLFAATALVAAPRVGEMVKIRVKHVTGEYILIEKTKCKMRNGIKQDPYRQVVKPDWYNRMLEGLLPMLNRKQNDYLFQNSRRSEGGQLTVQGANNRVRLIFRDCDIDLKGQLPTMHTFRKTCADFLYRASGNDLSLPNKHLGHASIANTAKYLNNSFYDYAERAKGIMG